MVLDIAGHTLDSATSLNLSPTNQLFTDYVDPLYKKDYWKFQLSSSSNFNLTLNGLSQDVNVELLDANGIVIKGSYNTGILAETINQNLNPGNYYLAVNLNSNTTDSSYNLNLSAYVSPVTAIESAGNTKLVKDAANKYYFTQIGTNAPTAIKNGGQQIYQDIYSGWQTLAAETVNGDNQVLWKDTAGNYLHIWHLDNNWNWVSSEGQWALNSTEALTQETNFGIDANSDGVIGNPYTAIESAGNTKLVKDTTNKYFTQVGTNTPIAIKKGGQQIYQDIYPGWQTIATETVNGDNQVLWKNFAAFLRIWHLDSNWNWVSSEGQWGLNSAEAFTQEINFGIDTNSDGIIGNPYSLIESAGNTKLVKDTNNKYVAQVGTSMPIPIKNSGQQIFPNIYPGWQTLAVETVSGDNQVLWKNVDGNYLHIWHLDNNWNWVSSEGQWALNSPEALTQETKFGIDANGDDKIGYRIIEASGNTTFLKDAANKYFTQIGTNTPTAIKNGGQQIYQDIYSGWQTIAAETVNRDNQVLWKNVGGNYLHIWHLDNNWNWVSSEGQWALNSPEASTQETKFGIDVNGDGKIGYGIIEAIGNTKLVKDAANKYFTQIGINTPTAIKNSGQQISQNIYGSDWQTIAAETVNGDNQVLWRNVSGNYLHIWHLDNNWNWVSSEGQWALNSPEASTQETKFGIDVNGDGKIGYGIIEASGNTTFLKDAANKYFTQIGTNTPTAIKNGGQQIYQDIYGSGWQTIAAETVNGDNQVLWKNVAGNYLHIWHLDNNWNWVSSEGQWALNSSEASTQETKFGIDANGDGFIGSDTLNTARDIVIGSSPIYDSVSSFDLNDFYRFTVSQSGIFTANLTGLTGDADVRLIQDKNNNGVIDTAQLYNSTTGIIDRGEILAWQWERGIGNETIRSFLNLGTYYLQVMSYNNQTANYNLATNFTPAVSDDRKFSIQLNFDSSMNATAQATIRKAADFWEKAISYSSFNGTHILTINVSKDSLLVGYSGTAGGTNAALDTNGNYLTISGQVNLSTEAVNILNTDTNANPDLITHEIGHVLGLVGGAATGTYNANTYAGWVYGELKGTFTQTAIPMETGMGDGLDSVHWNQAVFGNEIMVYVPGSTSQLSLAALRDVGWNINYGVAQPYSLPALGGTGNSLTTAITDFGTVAAGSYWIWKQNNIVSSPVPDRFYKFKFDGIGTLNVTLDNLTADANMRLIYDANNNGIIDAGEVIATSTKTGTTSEFFNLSNLAAGTYYVDVYATNYVDSFGNKVSINTWYNLNFNNLAASAPLIGNNLTTVTKDFGNFSPSWYAAWNSSVGDSNFDDLYRFNFTENANFTVNLTGLTDNADISVIYDSNKNGLIDPGEVILTSNNLGNLSENITRAGLLPGTYYFHINRVGSANTPYQFRIAAITDFGTVAAGSYWIWKQNNIVNSEFPDQFYKFKFDGIGTLNVTLDNLTADANMRLIYDANNNGIFEPSEVIATSTNTGTTSESFNLSNLAAGNYYVDVYATNYLDSFGNKVNINTSYNLNFNNLAASAPLIGNNLTTVTKDFGNFSPGWYAAWNSSVGDSNFDDLYRFNFTENANFTVNLTGLTDNADISVIYDSNKNSLIDAGEVILTSSNLGNLSENITRAGLLPGTYYFHINRVGSANTPYNFRLDNNNVVDNTLNTARNIVVGSTQIYDSVSNIDLNDFACFTVTQSGIFTANLTGLTGDADVRLIQDKNNNGVIDTAQLYNPTTGTIDAGEILAWQWERGTGNEAIRSFLNPGTYYLQVMSYNNQTANYNLATNFTPAASDNRKFSIQLNFDSSMNATAQATIRKAADFWEKAISYSSFNGSQILTINVSEDNSISGWGAFAGASITTVDANGRAILNRPISGGVHLSSDVVNGLNINSNSGNNTGLLIHEMGHILGIVGWDENSVDLSTGNYNANTYAGWAYGELKGTFAQTAIPLTTGVGNGSDYVHWKEQVFGNEAMSQIFGGATASLSQLSLAALRDVGWNVNYGVAQPYSLPQLGGTGNTLTTATTDFGTVAVGVKWGISNQYNYVNSEFSDRFYKIKSDGIGTLNVTLDNLTADANMRLIYDANNNGIIDADEVIATSTNIGTTSESFNLSNLAGGTYYVDVYATNYVDSFGNKVNINTAYNLNTTLTVSAPPIGNNLKIVSADFGTLTPKVYNYYYYADGFVVGDSSIDDLFRFNFAGTTNLTFNLTELTDNADMRLIYDSNNNDLIDPGEVIATSTNLGNLSETITLSGLLAGNYYLYVYRFASTVNTRYRLQLENLVIT